MQQNLKTYYLLILDRSGSMDVVRKSTLSAINEQIGQIKTMQLKYPEQSFIVSLLTFNENITPVLERLPALELRQIKSREYVPGGMTALYDAMGSGISTLKQQVGQEIEKNLSSAVVAVFTDGYENASREYSYHQIRKLIAELDEHPNWTFSYIGSTIDAMEIAISLNIRAENAMRVKHEDLAYESIRNAARIDSYAKKKREGSVSKDFLRKDEMGE